MQTQMTPSFHSRDTRHPARRGSLELDRTYQGSCLPLSFFTSPYQDVSNTPQSEHMTKNLNTVIDWFTHLNGNQGKLNPEIVKTCTPNPSYKMIFFPRYGSTPRAANPPPVRVEAQFQVINDLMAFTLPYETFATTMLHKSSSSDADVYLEIRNNDPHALTIQSYVVKTERHDTKAILNLEYKPLQDPPVKNMIFAARTKEEIVWFVDKVFRISLHEYHDYDNVATRFNMPTEREPVVLAMDLDSPTDDEIAHGQ